MNAFLKRHSILIGCLLIAILAPLTSIGPHILHPRMVPDRGDPIFSAWRVARLAHQVANDPADLLAHYSTSPLVGA